MVKTIKFNDVQGYTGAQLSSWEVLKPPHFYRVIDTQGDFICLINSPASGLYSLYIQDDRQADSYMTVSGIKSIKNALRLILLTK